MLKVETRGSVNIALIGSGFIGKAARVSRLPP